MVSGNTTVGVVGPEDGEKKKIKVNLGFARKVLTFRVTSGLFG